MSRASTRARLARAVQAFGVLVVFTLVLGQLAVIGHYALVAHYFCAEHGTLHHGRAPELVARARHATPQSVSALPRDDHGSHDNCSFPARRSTSLVDPRPAELVSPASEAEAALTSVTEAEPASSIPLYALAPKQSPPVG